MRCAIYARKSTEDDRHEHNKSTTRQIEHTRQFIQVKGWTVAEDHIYTDDGISGAEFQNRPGFQALIAALKPKSFDAIVCSEPSRLGRDMTFTAYHIRQIVDADVRIFYYLTGEEEKADTPEARLIGTIKGYADEMERVRSRQRVRDAHYRLASQGYVTGTKVYGYRNVPVYNDGDHPSPVKLEIHPEEAQVVRRIFETYADGYGIKLVARQLNEQGIAAPRSERWWDGTIRALLHQELYRGRMIWGRTRKEDRNGRTGLPVKQTMPAVTLERPDLAIIDQALWDAVHARMKEARTNYLRDGNGRLLGKPVGPSRSSALLSGLGACGVCGGGMSRITGGVSSARAYYTCCKNHKQGLAACTNNFRQRVEDVDKVFLEGLQREVLTPAVTRRILELAADRLRREIEAEPSKVEGVKRQLAKIKAEMGRLVTSIADGNAPQSVLNAIREREDRQKVVSQEIARLEAIPALTDTDLDEAMKEIEQDLASFGDILRESRPKATQALKKVLPERLSFHVEGDGQERYYRLEGALSFGKVLDLAARSTRRNSPRDSNTLLDGEGGNVPGSDAHTGTLAPDR